MNNYPEYYEHVLVWGNVPDEGEYRWHEAFWTEDNLWWVCWAPEDQMTLPPDEVEHWKPMPPPPTGQEDSGETSYNKTHGGFVNDKGDFTQSGAGVEARIIGQSAVAEGVRRLRPKG